MSFGAPKRLEKYRIIPPGYEPGDKQNGAFHVKEMGLRIIISNGMDWEHVSVSRSSRTPSYEDMVWVKDLFWDDNVCVMQLHVPREEHVNCHDYCLHMWRPLKVEIPRPPALMVGPGAET